MLPLFGLPRGDTPTLLAVTTVIELAKLAVVAYWLWRWKKDNDALKQHNDERRCYLDEQDRILAERARESEQRHAESMKQLHALIERTNGNRSPGLDRG